MKTLKEWKRETERFLKSCGSEMLEELFIFRKAEYFWLACFGSALFFGFLGSRLHGVLCFMGLPAGALFPAGILYLSNEQDNRRIMKELLWLYETIIVQLEAGMQIQEALMESEGMIGSKRLKRALRRLAERLLCGEETGAVLQEFEDSFRNPYITSFCIILRQLQESGYAVELLHDIQLQMEEMERVSLARKRDALGMQLELFQLLLFSGIMALILYACVISLMQKIPGI